jgi:hypothetical protein
VPWALLLGQLAITTVVIGILSFVLVVQLTLVPGAIFGEFDGIMTGFVSWAVDGVTEIIAALIVFFVTGLIVGLIGMPVRLIPPLRRLWLGNGEATLAGAVLGGLLILIAYAPFGTWEQVHLDHGTYPVFTPSPWPLLVGWLLLALSLSLIVWPVRWMPRRARIWWTQTQLTRHPRRAITDSAVASR